MPRRDHCRAGDDATARLSDLEAFVESVERDPNLETHEALAWFGETPAPGDWVNETWISRNGAAEIRLVDVVTAPGVHALLLGMKPSDDPAMRWSDLDYESLHRIVDEVRMASADRGFPLMEVSGPLAETPTTLLED